MVINTLKDLFKYTHLLIDIAAALAVLQQTMDTVLQGLMGVVCYLDDSIVMCKDKAKHFKEYSRIWFHVCKRNATFCKLLLNI